MPRKKKIVVEEKKKEIEKKSAKGNNYISTTGKRKTAIAQIRFNNDGSGKIIINGRDWKEYFPYEAWQTIITSPLELLDFKNYEVRATVRGGGLQAQAESIRLGISKALVKLDQESRKILKPKGFLSRDSRIKERKKPGLKRARRAPQWQKR